MHAIGAVLVAVSTTLSTSDYLQSRGAAHLPLICRAPDFAQDHSFFASVSLDWHAAACKAVPPPLGIPDWGAAECCADDKATALNRYKARAEGVRPGGWSLGLDQVTAHPLVWSESEFFDFQPEGTGTGKLENADLRTSEQAAAQVLNFDIEDASATGSTNTSVEGRSNVVLMRRLFQNSTAAEGAPSTMSLAVPPRLADTVPSPKSPTSPTSPASAVPAAAASGRAPRWASISGKKRLAAITPLGRMVADSPNLAHETFDEGMSSLSGSLVLLDLSSDEESSLGSPTKTPKQSRVPPGLGRSKAIDDVSSTPALKSTVPATADMPSSRAKMTHVDGVIDRAKEAAVPQSESATALPPDPNAFATTAAPAACVFVKAAPVAHAARASAAAIASPTATPATAAQHTSNSGAPSPSTKGTSPSERKTSAPPPDPAQSPIALLRGWSRRRWC